MQIVEVKNNLVKISYDTSTKLVLSGFMVIKDSVQSFIAQIIHLEASQYGTYAVLKLLFTFDDAGVISNYNGSIPDAKCMIDVVQPQELLELLPVQNPIFLGELAQQTTLLNLDRKFLEEKLLICSEKQEDNELLAKNILLQLVKEDKKVLVIDLNGTFETSAKKIVAGKNFKLPLNYDTINFIYEKGLEDAKAETRALIQDIFLEVQNYVKTLPEKFIPFETFKDVVDSQYEELELVELVLLKNKLLKYYEAGIFAQSKTEFSSLENSLKTSALTVLDLSKVDEKIQREILSYAYSVISGLGEETYVILNVKDENSDKKLLKQIFTTQNAYSSIICEYSYKYLKELKQLAKNLIMFAPIQQQDDYAGYGVFLSKLNAHEFVVYGSLTHHLPLIVRLEAYSKYFEAPTEIARETEPVEVLDEQISRDLDEIYTVPKSETVKPEEFGINQVEEELQDELTEDDLELLDDFDVLDAQEEENIIQDDETIVDKLVETPDFGEEPFIEEAIEEPVIAEFEQVEEIEEPSGSDSFDFSQIEEESVVAEDAVAEEEAVFENQPSESFSSVMAQQSDLEPPEAAILPANLSSTPIVPIYSADIEPQVQSDDIEQGDVVVHPKYGKGTVEKLITYGSKTLFSINFDNVGRRLLDPTLAEIKKAN